MCFGAQRSVSSPFPEASCMFTGNADLVSAVMQEVLCDDSVKFLCACSHVLSVGH